MFFGLRSLLLWFSPPIDFLAACPVSRFCLFNLLLFLYLFGFFLVLNQFLLYFAGELFANLIAIWKLDTQKSKS